MQNVKRHRLAAYKETLSVSGGDPSVDLSDTQCVLRQYQEEPVMRRKYLEKIPMLSREDIDKEIAPIYNKEVKLCDIPVMHHDIHTNDIVYLDLLFDVDDCREYMPQMSFLKTLLGYMDTASHSYSSLDTEINFHTGGIGADVNFYRLYGEEDASQGSL